MTPFFTEGAVRQATLALILAATSMVATAQSTVFGEGRTPIGAGDAASIRATAKQAALRDAVLKGIKDATAIDASDPRFAAIVNEVAKQLRDVQVREERREGSDFVTRVEALVDRREIKNAIRGTELDKLNDRSFSILMLVDEFLTSTRDLKLPLRELEEFNSDSGTSFSDKSLKASAASSSSKVAVAGSSSVDAAAASSTKVSGSDSSTASVQGRDAYGSGSATAAQNSSFSGQTGSASAYKSKDSFAGSASAQSANAAVDQKNVSAKSHDKVSYRKLVEYQDTSKPQTKSTFLAAFSGNMRDYDLRMQDSGVIRSKFFGDKVISLAALENSADLAKFAEYSRKANADFLMIGNATVIDGGKSAVTGEIECSVSANVKVFATAGSEVIAASTRSTQSSGMNIEECAAKASKKVADLISPEFAGRTLGYWADRSARGRQFTVELRGSGLALPMRLGFSRALKDIPGATDLEKKDDSDAGVKITMTLKGKADAMEEVYGAVSASPAFAGKVLDGKAEGENIVLCLGKCAADTKTALAKDKKK